MVPAEVDYIIWNARGNMASCTAIGFISLLGLNAGLLYNCSLNLYFLAVVKFNKSDEYIRTKIEPFLHGLPMVIAIGNATIFLLNDMFNPELGGSCVEPFHDLPHCSGFEDGEVRDGFTIPCGRGSKGGGKLLIITMMIWCAPPVIIIFSLGIVYDAVLKQEKKISKYGVGALRSNLQQTAEESDEDGTSRGGPWQKFKGAVSTSAISMGLKSSADTSTSSRANSMRHQSRAVMQKAVAYACSYFLVWFSLIVLSIFQLFHDRVPISLIYLLSILCPLQGLYNLIIFMFPRIMQARTTRRHTVSWRKAVMTAFWSRGASKFFRREFRRGISDGYRQGNVDFNQRRGRLRTKRLRSEAQTDSQVILVSAEEEKREVQAPQDMPLLPFGRETPRRHYSIMEEDCEIYFPLGSNCSSKDHSDGSNVSPSMHEVVSVPGGQEDTITIRNPDTLESDDDAKRKEDTETELARSSLQRSSIFFAPLIIGALDSKDEDSKSLDSSGGINSRDPKV